MTIRWIKCICHSYNLIFMQSVLALLVCCARLVIKNCLVLYCVKIVFHIIIENDFYTSNSHVIAAFKISYIQYGIVSAKRDLTHTL